MTQRKPFNRNYDDSNNPSSLRVSQSEAVKRKKSELRSDDVKVDTQ